MVDRCGGHVDQIRLFQFLSQTRGNMGDSDQLAAKSTDRGGVQVLSYRFNDIVGKAPKTQESGRYLAVVNP